MSTVDRFVSLCRTAAGQVQFCSRTACFDRQIFNLPYGLLNDLADASAQLAITQPPIHLELRGHFFEPHPPVLGINTSIRALEPFEPQPYEISEVLRYCTPWGIGENPTTLHQNDSGLVHLGSAITMADDEIHEIREIEGVPTRVCLADIMTGYHAYRWRYRVGFTELNSQFQDEVSQHISRIRDCLNAWVNYGPNLVGNSRPSLTASAHPLPLQFLSAETFERLCFWLLEKEGYENVQHYGASGADGGRDILAEVDGAAVVFQCKRVQNFSRIHVEQELIKLRQLDQIPSKVHFLVACNVSAATRDTPSDSIELIFWGSTELDYRIKQYPELVQEFFNPHC